MSGQICTENNAMLVQACTCPCNAMCEFSETSIHSETMKKSSSIKVNTFHDNILAHVLSKQAYDPVRADNHERSVVAEN